MLATLLSVLVAVLLLVSMIIELNKSKTFVYVAEVKPTEGIVNVRPASMAYQPTIAQKQAFISDFIKNITEIPLDPVVLNSQWRMALNSVTGQATQQLKEYYEGYKPMSDIGTKTVSVRIINVNNLGNNSFDFTWRVTRYDRDGSVSNVAIYNGVFTLAKNQSPTTLSEMLVNPLGFKIGFFSFNQKGSSR